MCGVGQRTTFASLFSPSTSGSQGYSGWHLGSRLLNPLSHLAGPVARPDHGFGYQAVHRFWQGKPRGEPRGVSQAKDRKVVKVPAGGGEDALGIGESANRRMTDARHSFGRGLSLTRDLFSFLWDRSSLRFTKSPSGESSGQYLGNT